MVNRFVVFYQRIILDPHVNPAPNAVQTIKSPFFNLPFSNKSLIASGMDAAEQFA